MGEQTTGGTRVNARENSQLTKSHMANLATNGSMCSRASQHLLDYSR